MPTNFPGWLAVVSGSELVIMISAGAYLGRKMLRDGANTRAVLAVVSTYIELDKVLAPRVQAQVDNMQEVVTENTAQIAVLKDRDRERQRWQERHERAHP